MASVYAITPVQDKVDLDRSTYVWAGGDGMPQNTDAAKVWNPPVFTCAITSCDSAQAVPLHWPIDIRLLKHIQAFVYGATLGSLNHVLSVLVGESLTADPRIASNGGLIDTSAGKAYASCAIIAETAVSNNELFRGSPAITLTNSVISTLISQLSPGVRLGRYFQLMMTPGSGISSPETIYTQLRGWYQ